MFSRDEKLLENISEKQREIQFSRAILQPAGRRHRYHLAINDIFLIPGMAKPSKVNPNCNSDSHRDGIQRFACAAKCTNAIFVCSPRHPWRNHVYSSQLSLPAVVISSSNIAQLVEQSRLGKGAALAVSFSPDGKLLAVASGTGIWLYYGQTGELSTHFLKDILDSVSTVAWSPNGDLLASGSGDATIRIWDPVHNNELFKLRVMKARSIASFGRQMARNWHLVVLIIQYDYGMPSMGDNFTNLQGIQVTSPA